MRAIIRMRAVNRDAWSTPLSNAGWSIFQRTSPEALRIIDDFLTTVADDDRDGLEQSVQGVFKHPPTRAVGIINYNPQETENPFVEIRLKDSEANALKAATESLVRTYFGVVDSSLSPQHGSLRVWPWRKPEQSGLYPYHINDEITVLEHLSRRHAFSGVVHRSRRFADVTREMHVEWLVGISALLVGVLMLILTFPGVEMAHHAALFLDTPEKQLWGLHTLERLSTAAFPTAAVSLAAVLLRYRSVRRRPLITWRAE